MAYWIVSIICNMYSIRIISMKCRKNCQAENAVFALYISTMRSSYLFVPMSRKKQRFKGTEHKSCRMREPQIARIVIAIAKQRKKFVLCSQTVSKNHSGGHLWHV